MTAEVAILTKQCVALAADSAVTTGDDKIFNTVNKLFALSKTQPVGIMVYSSAEIMGVPVETVVKEFRRERGTTKCSHLELYAYEFENYLRTNTHTFSAEGRTQSAQNLVAIIASALNSQVNKAIRREKGKGGQIDVRALFANQLDTLEKAVMSAPRLQTLKGWSNRAVLKTSIEPALAHWVKRLQDDHPMDAAQSTRFRNLATEHFYRDIGFGGETGFVIAGFGTADVFPRLRGFEIYCSAPGAHKVRERCECNISLDLIATIRPFAQDDVMRTFIEGMDPAFGLATNAYLERFFEKKVEKMLAMKPPQKMRAAALKAIGEDLVKEFGHMLRNLSEEKYTAPMMQVVSSMPKEELALLAEAFINLTALKRRSSTDAESVGGPTDVAVISKGDGFIWIKRKHYFDPRLNPGFCPTYLEERNDD